MLARSIHNSHFLLEILIKSFTFRFVNKSIEFVCAIKMVGKDEVIISEAEAALYDRQIRLWGLEAQKRYCLNKCTFLCSIF